MAKGAWVMRTAVMVSILAHASLIGAAGLRKPTVAPTEPPPAADIWAGTTAMPVGSEELVDVDTLGGSAPETPPAAPPAPVAPPGADEQDSIPVEPPKLPSVPDKPVLPDKPAPKAPSKTTEPAKPKPAADKPDTSETPKPEEDETSADKAPEAPPAPPAPTKKPADAKDATPADQDKPSDQDKPVARDEPAPELEKKPARTAKRPKPSPVAPVPASATSAEANPDASAKAPSGGSFGAEGAVTVRDLGRAFTRALPAACSSDKTWSTLAVGNAGSIEVVLDINEEGKVNGFEPITKNPPAHLMDTVKRTLAMMRGGTFAIAGGSVTAGQQVLRLSAELSDQVVTEEEASGAVILGLEFDWNADKKKGVASFTQATGRKVKVTVEFVRVLPPKT